MINIKMKFVKEIFAFWLYVENFWKDMIENRLVYVQQSVMLDQNQKFVIILQLIDFFFTLIQVLFTQFVGRCLRKIQSDDPVEATILSHVAYNQKQNYDNLNEVAEDDPDEDEDND